MRQAHTTRPLLVLLIALVPFGATYAAEPVPLTNAYAHNDYLHERPLLDALDHGFCNIEVDVWLIDGELLVAHTREEIVPGRTIQKLYLDPLHERIRRNGGTVYPGIPEFILMIDIKGNGRTAYPHLRKVLKQYQDVLTTYTDNGIEIRAIRAIISGSRPKAIMQAYKTHYAAFDGRLGDLDSDLSPHFMPIVSTNWPGSFKWTGEGPMPLDQRKKLRDLVARAHEQDRKIRFWATPHNETIWKELLDAHVDLINVDDLPRLQKFLSDSAD